MTIKEHLRNSYWDHRHGELDADTTDAWKLRQLRAAYKVTAWSLSAWSSALQRPLLTWTPTVLQDLGEIGAVSHPCCGALWDLFLEQSWCKSSTLISLGLNV